MHSLNTVMEHQPWAPHRAQGQANKRSFDQRSTPSPPGHHSRQMMSDYPLLKMMEQRIAAAASAAATRTAASPSPHLPAIAQLPSLPLPAMSNENRTALEASISKWAGVGDNNGCGGRGEERKLEVSINKWASMSSDGGLCEGGGEEKKADDVRTTTALQQRLLPFLGPAYAQKQSPSVGSVGLSTSSTPRNLSLVSPSSGSDRVPLSATQVKLLKELMGSDSQKDVLQRMLHDQTGEGGGRSLTSNIQLACGGG